MNNVYLALNICTYKREEYLLGNLSMLRNSLFFTDEHSKYFGKMDIFITDNASELNVVSDEYVHFFHNPNTGGSGGFQRGIEEIRKSGKVFTNVIFMDDDVKFELSSFYILYDFLCEVSEENAERPIAGRMLDIDNPNIQWTAAEKWNSGKIQHIEFLRNITDPSNPYTPGKVVYDVDADYGGFWFCCYPYSFVKNNDILPFFLHCDDVEYGLRCGKKPIIIEGVHIWHQTWEKKYSPLIMYYDLRNSLIVNQIYGLLPAKTELYKEWINRIDSLHSQKDYLSEYITIIAILDYMKGINEIFNNSLEQKKNVSIKRGIRIRSVFLKIKLLYICRLQNYMGR